MASEPKRYTVVLTNEDGRKVAELSARTVPGLELAVVRWFNSLQSDAFRSFNPGAKATHFTMPRIEL